ncbi:pentatricopeptide repeat-containing protein At5g56310-like [Musa acuminata AAA Group]|uniref:pentatricopeptide repeat-containing protein At5g56310-like n=1 Tax=Musa acuminata AAA Group TaxID=214697 RepID=UPI0031DFB7C3
MIGGLVMIGGLAINGHGAEALELFGQMERDAVKPNEVTFIGVLCACSHGGLVEQARQCFDSMRAVYGLKPQIEHYGCMVDVLGRAGFLEEAVFLVQSMANDNAVLWGSLLSACLIHGNAKLGEYVVDRLVEHRPDDGGVFVLLLNIYAARGRWDDARKTRMLMKLRGLKKILGCSSTGMFMGLFMNSTLENATEIYDMSVEISSVWHQGRRRAKPGSSPCQKRQRCAVGESAQCMLDPRECQARGIRVDRLVELRPDDGGVYVLLSNIYAARGRQDDARKTRMLKLRGLKKILGCSSIGVFMGLFTNSTLENATEIYDMSEEISSVWHQGRRRAKPGSSQ